jgi:lipopolysaccharide transport system ATP-binding protein
MSELAIVAENISKKYQLGEIHSGTFLSDARRWWTGKSGTQSMPLPVENASRVLDNSFWALKDINFQIKRGEAIGIVGGNGAGKSTLLKILSRVTAPTSGSIKYNGKIASLLEVGTGFHPELTGRENIFLNGAILGMSRVEVRQKFDEIVDFSGVEQFIDTPVKHYSSGMYVRLAFAVAAHLVSEILVIDEVLAVGDAEFQRKCLGKIGDVTSQQGRTVLFVSHNLGMLVSLCAQSIYLNEGRMVGFGETTQIVNQYLSGAKDKSSEIYFDPKMHPDTDLMFSHIAVVDSSGEAQSEISVTDSFNVRLDILARNPQSGVDVAYRIKNQYGLNVFTSSIEDQTFDVPGQDSPRFYRVESTVKPLFLSPGKYFVSVGVHRPHDRVFDAHEDVISFNIAETGSTMMPYKGNDTGAVLVDFPHTFNILENGK